MKLKFKVILLVLSVVLIGLGALGYYGLRFYRASTMGADALSQVRFLVQSGGTIGEVPADMALSSGYLAAIFGDSPELLEQLQRVIQRGLAEDTSIRLGEVAAMVVTYRTSEDGEVEDVVAHVIGGFPLARRRPGFHRDGYFRGLIDSHLWEMGNTLVGYLGRDMLLFAEDHLIEQHEEFLEAIFAGNIMPLIHSMDRPFHYTAVFPDPRHLLPPRLRRHVQAVVVKGELSPHEGFWDALLITPSARSAAYAQSIFSDMRTLAIFGLETKWRGVKRKVEWGYQIDPWWAYEMVQNLKEGELVQEENTVRMRTEFDRVMVNVVMKCVERMSRDLAQQRMTQGERMDPRLTDARLATRKPQHYWMEEHRWGPDWPFPNPHIEELAMADSPEDGEADVIESL